MNRSVQSGGDQSINMQAGGAITIIQPSISAEDVIAIARMAAESQFDELVDKAGELATERAVHLVMDKLIPELRRQNPEGIWTFGDPDVQFAMMSAQRAYARSGDENMADILVDILVERTRETQRSIRQLALTESLEVAAKLTTDQLSALTLVWLITYSRFEIDLSVSAFQEQVRRQVRPFLETLKVSQSVFQHLEYAGCGSISQAYRSLEGSLGAVYPGIFGRGFNRPMVATMFGGLIPDYIEYFITECLHDADEVQIGMMSEDELRAVAAARGVKTGEVELLVQLLNTELLDYDSMVDVFADGDSELVKFRTTWNTSGLAYMTLTTVGMVIAHANFRRVTGASAGPLETWIQ